jgi:hypothetical protein
VEHPMVTNTPRSAPLTDQLADPVEQAFL